MATIAPMAEWKPFTGKGTTPLAHDIICAHTMVGKLMGSWDWANQSGNAYWHYGLGADGRLLQCHDLAYRSAANLEGNDRVIPIETEDGYPDGRTSDAGKVWDSWSGSNVPAWTNAQVDKLVDLCVWLCKKYNIPPVLIPDTKQGRRGLAYHRQGIDPWRVGGGEKWSNSDGKVCPGDRRVSQWVNVVIPRVKALVTGEEDDMTPEQAEELHSIAVATVKHYQDAQPPDARFRIQTLVAEAVDNRFATSGSPTRVQLVGEHDNDPKGLVEYALERSEKFAALEAKVDHIIEMLHEETTPGPE